MIAGNLKYLRNVNKWSQTKVARLLGIASSLYQHQESGRSKPSISTLIRLSELYSVDLKYLITVDLSKKVNGNQRPANRFYAKYNQQPKPVKKAINILLGMEK